MVNLFIKFLKKNHALGAFVRNLKKDPYFDTTGNTYEILRKYLSKQVEEDEFLCMYITGAGVYTEEWRGMWDEMCSRWNDYVCRITKYINIHKKEYDNNVYRILKEESDIDEVH